MVMGHGGDHCFSTEAVWIIKTGATPVLPMEQKALSGKTGKGLIVST
jgi:hypothetical protein